MYFDENVYVNYLKAILRIIDTHTVRATDICGRTSEKVCQVYTVVNLTQLRPVIMLWTKV